jgi:hypothetical protein
MFRALLAYPKEPLHKRHLLQMYCLRVMSVGCTSIGVPVYICTLVKQNFCVGLVQVFFGVLVLVYLLCLSDRLAQYWMRSTDHLAAHYEVFFTPLLPRPS